MSFGLEFKVKGMFFDRLPVQKMLNAKERKSLSKIGAYIRRSARSSIRRRRRVSAPGSPPSAHSTHRTATIKNILFAYDQSRHSVVTGPVLLHLRHIGITNSGTIPETLEEGGTVLIKERDLGTQGRYWTSMINRRSIRPGEKTRRRRAVYKPRPFMGPALRANQAKIPKIFAAA